MLNYLIFGITYAFAAGVQPGPLQTYIISQTIEKGWRSTLPAIFAPLISDLPIVVLILFLLSSVPEGFIVFLRIGGGLFLLYLGYRAYKSWRNYNPDEAISNTSGKQTLFSAALVNLFNPNPYLGWSLIMGPMLLEGWRIEPVNGIALLAGFYITLIITLAATIIIFAFARKLGPKISKLLLGISSIVLFLFGLYQLSLGIYYFVNMQ
jgi:threonine/homoserine/homoserine lactone efflux protein